MITVDLVERMTPGHLVHHYLISSFCYYHLHESPMTDDAFDRLCVRLLAVHDTIDHPHLHLIAKGDLEAGSCFLKFEDFPNLVQRSAEHCATLARAGELYSQVDAALPAIARTVRVARRPPPGVPIPAVRAPARVVRRPASVPVAVEAPAAPARRIVRTPPRK